MAGEQNLIWRGAMQITALLMAGHDCKHGADVPPLSNSFCAMIAAAIEIASSNPNRTQPRTMSAHAAEVIKRTRHRPNRKLSECLEAAVSIPNEPPRVHGSANDGADRL